jgi:SAM-dependent methyltransferase
MDGTLDQTHAEPSTRHLDLGCGRKPRNPYRRDAAYGVDIADVGLPNVVRANLAMEPIPFPDSHFDSVSAYDFLEHVPRLLPNAAFSAVRFPFIELMNEIHRVLVPGGLFYAITPAYPHPDAFVDPTHVNVLTAKSHRYFCAPSRFAAMYGYTGNFNARRVEFAVQSENTLYVDPPRNALVRLKRFLERISGSLSHVVWEFEAVK